MLNKNEVTFPGQIETVLKESVSDIDIKVKNIFRTLRVMSHLTSAGIRKLDVYSAFQLLYELVNLIFIHIDSISCFARRNLVALRPTKKATLTKTGLTDIGGFFIQLYTPQPHTNFLFHRHPPK